MAEMLLVMRAKDPLASNRWGGLACVQERGVVAYFEQLAEQTNADCARKIDEIKKAKFLQRMIKINAHAKKRFDSILGNADT